MTSDVSDGIPTISLARMLSTDDSPRYLGGLLGRIGDLADTLG